MTAAAATMSPLLIPQPYVVVDKIQETDDIVTLHVYPVDGELPTFEPAQVGMLGVFGIGEAAISVSSDTATRDYHAYTIRRAGPISGALVDTPVAGIITVRGPFGTPWPIDGISTGEVLIAAGGLGIAPLRAAIFETIRASHRFDRIGLVYGAKSPAELVYTPDLHRWNNSAAELTLTVDAATDGWQGSVGLVPDVFDREVKMNWEDTTAFVCGPDIMMHFTAQKLVELGTEPHNIWLTLERNMQCGNALCGHCQLGPFIVCRDGPVVNYAEIARFHVVKEL